MSLAGKLLRTGGQRGSIITVRLNQLKGQCNRELHPCLVCFNNMLITVDYRRMGG